MIIILDSNLLGIITSPKGSQEGRNCLNWLLSLAPRGAYAISSQVCDYEVRRGLLEARKRGFSSTGIERLNDSQSLIDFLPVTQEVLSVAAELWAEARVQSKPGTGRDNLDVDVILAAHWQLLSKRYPGRRVVVATTNVKHFNLFVDADLWENISF